MMDLTLSRPIIHHRRPQSFVMLRVFTLQSARRREWGSASVADLQRQTDEGEGAARDSIDVAQVLHVQHAALAAHHVDGLHHPRGDLVKESTLGASAPTQMTP